MDKKPRPRNDVIWPDAEARREVMSILARHGIKFGPWAAQKLREAARHLDTEERHDGQCKCDEARR